jgi:hypothetical protein
MMLHRAAFYRARAGISTAGVNPRRQSIGGKEQRPSRQVPKEPGTTQLTHGALHATLQQTPSAQKALAHSVDRAHAAPFGFFSAGTGEHLPSLPGWLQDIEGSVQATSQQTPLEQKPDAHSSPVVQGGPELV